MGTCRFLSLLICFKRLFMSMTLFPALVGFDWLLIKDSLSWLFENDSFLEFVPVSFDEIKSFF